MNCILLFESDLLPGTRTARLSSRRFEHVRGVQRVTVGDTLTVGLVNDRLGTGTVTVIGDTHIDLDIMLDRAPPEPLPLTLIVALPRPKSLRKVIHAATTLGIKRIYIIESWRVEKSYWQSPFLGEKRLREFMLLGLEQCVDTVLPSVQTRRRFKPFVEDEIPGIVQGASAFVAHPRSSEPCPRSTTGPVVLAIGPEAGFIPYEIEAFETRGFRSVTLGDRVLRVEEALPALVGRLF
jgi:RsmE family RNA methyltransferase